MVIYRLPEEKSLGGRSKCRHCRKQIPWFWNIPLVSFALLQGKTACCRKRISVQYPLVELATGLLFVALYHQFGLGVHFLCYSVFTSGLLVLSVIDYHHQIIPDEISLGGIPLGFLASFLTHDITWASSLMGIAVGGGIFYAVAYAYEAFTGQEGLGGGDIKLLAMLGAWLGLESILIVIVLSTLAGSALGLILMAGGKAGSKSAIAFGPFLAIAGAVFLFWRETLLSWFFPLFFPT